MGDRRPTRRRAGRRDPRLGREDGPTRLGVGSRSGERRPRDRRGSGRRCHVHARNRERLVAAFCGRRARPRLSPDGQCGARPLRRRASRTRSLCERRRRPRSPHGRARVGFQDRASRLVGLRRCLAARALHPSGRGSGRRHPGSRPGDQDGTPVPARSTNGRAPLSGRDAPGSARRRDGRGHRRASALPQPARAAASALATRRRGLGTHADRPRTMSKARRESAQRRHLHAALA